MRESVTLLERLIGALHNAMFTQQKAICNFDILLVI